MPIWVLRLLSVLFCLLVGGLGGFATSQGLQAWYPALVKPWFNPPNYLFGPVWTILYSFMGWVLAELWARPVSAERRQLLGLFFVQLGLNFAWSFLFFAWQMPGLALVEILVLGALLWYLLYRFYGTYRAGFWLWLPYCLWVSFATLLNAALWYFN